LKISEEPVLNRMFRYSIQLFGSFAISRAWLFSARCKKHHRKQS